MGISSMQLGAVMTVVPVLCTCLPSCACFIISIGIKQQLYIYAHTKPVSALYSESKAFLKIPNCPLHLLIYKEMKSRGSKNLKYLITA